MTMKNFRGTNIPVLTEADLFAQQGILGPSTAPEPLPVAPPVPLPVAVPTPPPPTLPSPSSVEALKPIAEIEPEPDITAIEDAIDGEEAERIIAQGEAPIPMEEVKTILGIGATPEESVADYAQKAEHDAKLADEVQPSVETGKKKRRKS